MSTEHKARIAGLRSGCSHNSTSRRIAPTSHHFWNPALDSCSATRCPVRYPTPNWRNNGVRGGGPPTIKVTNVLRCLEKYQCLQRALAGHSYNNRKRLTATTNSRITAPAVMRVRSHHVPRWALFARISARFGALTPLREKVNGSDNSAVRRMQPAL
jgi:hypothetical protein